MRFTASGAVAGLFTLLPLCLAAQVSVSGRVTGDAKPAARASIEAVGADSVRHRATADADGRYRLSLPAGEYAIRFRILGYAPNKMDAVSVVEGEALTVDAELKSLAVELPTFVITASRRSEQTIDAPVSVSVVTDQAIREHTTVSPLDQVAGLPGVDVVAQGLQTRQVVARGFNANFGTSLLMLTDYRNASLPSMRANLSQNINAGPDDIDRIEVLRGPASALYGPNAADGVVHFVTKSPFDSPGTTLSLTGGGRSLWDGAARYAVVLGDRFAFKISGQYLHGKEWDAPAQSTELTPRDPLVERVNGELRADFRVSPSATLIATAGSVDALRHIEYTTIGASQVRKWHTDFVQLRFTNGPLFAQAYLNLNGSGDQSFNLRSNQPVRDHSTVAVGQMQYVSHLPARSTVTWGVDVARTDPQTVGSVNGRNEENDDFVESGAYAHLDIPLTSTLKMLATTRADWHSRMSGTAFSPRLGFVYAPAPAHRVRASWNRAFSNPTSTDLFVDIIAARLDPLPFAIRAVGVPQEGFHFSQDCSGGLCMTSPFAAGSLPVDAAALWPAVVAIMSAGGVDLSGIPAPTAADVPTSLGILDLSVGAFVPYSGSPNDIPALKRTITNSFEVGYRGVIGNVLADVALYTTRRQNFRGPLAVETPNAFLQAAALATYLGRYMPAANATALANAIGGIPLGTVSPEGRLGGPDIMLTYRSMGDVRLWGTDLSAETPVTAHMTVGTAYTYVSDNFFAAKNARETDLSMNAPKHKAAASVKYHEARNDLSAGLRVRYVGGFRMLDGVWSGDVPAYTLADIDVGFAVPRMPGARLTLSVQNIADARHAEFIGAPVLGRLFLTKIHYQF